VTGDGTTSTVLLCGELLRQTERYASEGLHPRVLVDGLEIARDATLEFLSSFTVAKPDALTDIDLLTSVARTSLQTKLDFDLAAILTQAVVSAITCVAEDANQPIDLNRVEIMTMERKLGSDSRFVNGIVLDHGGRHPDMPSILKNCHIMTCNVTFEYEKTEVASGFFYSNAEEREKLVESERKWLDERCKQVIDFKRSVCQEGEVGFCAPMDALLIAVFVPFLPHYPQVQFFYSPTLHPTQTHPQFGSRSL
jgi:T-complex protein 1 subunit zeta